MSTAVFNRRALGSLVGLGLIAPRAWGAASAKSSAPSVAVGEIVIALESSKLEPTRQLVQAVRLALLEELSQLTELGARLRQGLVVSAALTNLSSEKRAQHASASARVSLALRRESDQVLFAELAGHARAEESSGDVASVRRVALRAAVRGAVRRLPEAVQRSG